MRYWNNKHKRKNNGYMGQPKAYKIDKVPYLAGLVYDREAQIWWLFRDLVDGCLASAVYNGLKLALPSSLEKRFCNPAGAHEVLMSVEVG